MTAVKFRSWPIRPGVGALGAEAREGDDDEARVLRGEALVPEVPPLERPGTEALDEDVRVARHLPERRGARRATSGRAPRTRRRGRTARKPAPVPPTSGGVTRIGSPECGSSTLMTRAPRSTRVRTRTAPGSIRETSRTTVPARGSGGVHVATFRNSLPNLVIAAMFETFTFPRRNAVSGDCCPLSMAR